MAIVAHMVRNTSIALLATLVALLLLEIFFRIADWNYIEINSPYHLIKFQSLPDGSNVATFPLAYDPRGYYSRSQGRIFTYYDQFGARWQDGKPRVLQQQRVVVLGDSFTFGYGLRYEDSYPALAEICLLARGKNISLLNYGRSARDVKGYLETYQSLKSIPPHDGIVLGLHLNDIVRFPTSKIINDIKHSYEEGSVAVSALYRFIARRVETAKERKRNIQEIIRQANEAEPFFRENIAALLTLRRVAREQGIFFKVLILPVFIDLKDYPFRSVNEQLHSILEGNNIEYIDVTRAFEGMDAESFWILPFDQHPNERATPIIAKTLCDILVPGS